MSTTTATAIRRVLPDGMVDMKSLRRVARVWGVLQWEDTDDHGNIPESYGIRNTSETLPVPDGWVAVR